MMMNRGACYVAKNLIEKIFLPYDFGSRGPEAEKEPYGSGSFRTEA